MQIILNIILPVFGLVMCGYFIAKIGWFKEDAAEGLARFVFDIGIPVLLFRTFSTADLPDNPPWDLLGSYYIPLLAVFFGTMFVAGKFFGRDLVGQSIFALTCSFGNLVLLATPLVLTAFGDQGAIPLFILISVHGLTLLTLSTLFLEIGKNSSSAIVEIPKKVLQGMITNPIIVSLLLGLAFNIFQIPTPELVGKMADMIKLAVTPCALFSLGVALTKYGIAGRLQQSVFIVSMKLLVLPLAVFVMAYFVFELDRLSMVVAVIMAAQPTGLNAFLFANRYNNGVAISTTSIFISTIISIFTLWTVMYLFEI